MPSAPTKGNKPLAKDVPAHKVIKLTISAAKGKKGIRKFYFSEDVRIIKLPASTPQRLKFLRRWVVLVVSVKQQISKHVPNHEFGRRRPIAWPAPFIPRHVSVFKWFDTDRQIS